MKFGHRIDKLFYRAKKLHDKHVPVLPKLILNYIRVFYAADISIDAQIHPTATFMHNGLGTVVGKGVVIGANTKIYQNVTLGGNGKSTKNGKPVIGENVILYAGCMVLGDVKVGNNAVVGANSVVMADVPEGSVAVGSPARIVK